MKKILIVLFGFSPSSTVRGTVFREEFLKNGYEAVFFQTHAALIGKLRQRILGWPRFLRLLIDIPLRLLNLAYICLRAMYLLTLVGSAHAVMLIKFCPPWLIPLIHARTRGRLLYEFDDPMWLDSFIGEKAFLKLIKHADYVSTDNTLMAEWVRRHHPENVFVVRGPAQVEVFEGKKGWRARTRNRVVVGWVGSRSTLPYLDVVVPALRRIAAKRSDFVFRVVGAGGADLSKILQGIPHEIRDHYDQQGMVEEVLALDIGLFPLFQNDELSVYRGTLKVRIYMSGGATVVSSNVGLVGEIINQGHNGLLATSDADWEIQIETLIADHALREKMGFEGYKTVLENYRIEHCFSDLSKGFLERIS
ncbi:MAG: glycosyltransferase [Bdellovibrionota bacterium]